eukprot:2214660-Alexandrium_andersonii.AAC.1
MLRHASRRFGICRRNLGSKVSGVAKSSDPEVVARESPVGGDRCTCAGHSGRSWRPRCSWHFHQAPWGTAPGCLSCQALSS